jgi:hypothetical protein
MHSKVCYTGFFDGGDRVLVRLFLSPTSCCQPWRQLKSQNRALPTELATPTSQGRFFCGSLVFVSARHFTLPKTVVGVTLLVPANVPANVPS